ncbi:acyltransferase family protein [Massilia aerilata]|uniref:Acyltransferase family protein n=1 Tax=Massilia aerilata TaxID=453817 RepID=A0ABW0RVR5_9BURK
MSSTILPKIQWQRQSQLDSNSVHSLLISLMRGLAALQVAAAHLRSEMFPGLKAMIDPPLYYQLLAFATGFAHQAVVVFFLISGWLVGGSLLNRIGQPGALLSYAIDRATRLWTVLVPAMCFMLAVGIFIADADPGSADFAAANEYSATAFVGNLLGLQTVLVKNFGGNYALWSLANETWYYIQFPLLLFVFMSRSRLRQLAAATALVLIAGALPQAITLYFTLWLLGALFSRVRIECGNGLRLALVAIGLGCSVWFRIHGSNDDLTFDSFLQDLVYSLPLLFILASLQRPLILRSAFNQGLAKVAHLLSEFSFTLYVIHIPTIKLLRYFGLQEFGRSKLAVDAPLDYAVYFGMLLALLGTAYVSYRLFESHTFRLRRAIKNAVQPQRVRPAIVSASAE